MGLLLLPVFLSVCIAAGAFGEAFDAAALLTDSTVSSVTWRGFLPVSFLATIQTSRFSPSSSSSSSSSSGSTAGEDVFVATEGYDMLSPHLQEVAPAGAPFFVSALAAAGSAVQAAAVVGGMEGEICRLRRLTRDQGVHIECPKLIALKDAAYKTGRYIHG